MGRIDRSTVLEGSLASITTAVPAVVPLRELEVPISWNRSWAWRRSASFSVWRRRSRFWLSVSSSLESSSSACWRARSALCSSMRWVLLFLLASAAASALALASAAFLAFSRSASESSASHDSRTWTRPSQTHTERGRQVVQQPQLTSLSSASSSSNFPRLMAPAATLGADSPELEDSSSSSAGALPGRKGGAKSGQPGSARRGRVDCCNQASGRALHRAPRLASRCNTWMRICPTAATAVRCTLAMGLRALSPVAGRNLARDAEMQRCTHGTYPTAFRAWWRWASVWRAGSVCSRGGDGWEIRSSGCAGRFGLELGSR